MDEVVCDVCGNEIGFCGDEFGIVGCVGMR